MNENEVMEMLAEDISRLRLPPISEKVLLAMREKRRDILEMNKPLVSTEKPHKNIPIKYIFAAMLTLLAVSVPIIVVLTNKVPLSDLPDSSVLPSGSETVSISESQVTSAAENETALERIKLTQIYGEVALSGKGEEELETLLVTYSTKDSVYEDEKYIYNFDSQGRLIEMRKAAFGDEEGRPVDEQEISAKVNTLLKEYCSDWFENKCDIRIEKNEDARPAWTVYVIKNNHDSSKEVLTATFDKTGTLRWMIFDGTTENIGVISNSEAVQIAIEELRSGKYDIPDFNYENIDITLNIRTIENQPYYDVVVANIPLEEDVYTGVYLRINADTGDIEQEYIIL